MEINEEQLNTDTAETVTPENDAPITDGNTALRKKSKTEIIINVALWIAIAVLIVMIVLRLFVFSNIRVSGESMMETYHNDDVVTVNKTLTPQRGDVVVFYKYDIDSKFKAMFASKEESGIGQPYEKLIKRVVAVEGDRLWVQQISANVFQVVIDTDEGRIFEDYYVKKGEKLQAFTVSFATLGRLAETSESNPLVIEKGHIFVMGDNRENSADSRGELGQVPLERMYGVVLDK